MRNYQTLTLIGAAIILTVVIFGTILTETQNIIAALDCIFAIVLVFAVKNKLKSLGIVLIILGITLVMMLAGDGFIGFLFFTIAGIIAIRKRYNKPLATRTMTGR